MRNKAKLKFLVFLAACVVFIGLITWRADAAKRWTDVFWNALVRADLKVLGEADIERIATADTGYMTISTDSKTHKYRIMGVSYVSATVMDIDQPGHGLVCTGLSGSSQAYGTEGNVHIADTGDTMLFTIQLPETFVDVGSASDLIIEFDINEQIIGDSMDLRVHIYDYGDTVPDISDTVQLDSDAEIATREWAGLQTLSDGIGADTCVAADNVLTIALFPETDSGDSGYIYGIRLKYRVGIEVTE